MLASRKGARRQRSRAYGATQVLFAGRVYEGDSQHGEESTRSHIWSGGLASDRPANAGTLPFSKDYAVAFTVTETGLDDPDQIFCYFSPL